MTRAALTGLWLLLGACAPKAHLLVLDAPDLAVPAEVRQLGVVHRVDGSEAGAASVAVAGFAEAVGDAPRLDAVPVQIVGAWPMGPLAPEAVVQTCAATGLDALVVLEALRGDTDLVLDETPATTPDDEAELHAQRTSSVHATWRLIGCDGRVLDQLDDVVTADRWSSDGVEAERSVPEGRASVVDLGRSSGIAYARRLAPSWTEVVRPYFAAGDPRLRHAARRLAVADYQGALELWDAVARSDRPPRIRARALHDMALGWEVLGRPVAAVRAVEEAHALHDSPRIERYLAVLVEQRTATRLLREPLAHQETEDP